MLVVVDWLGAAVVGGLVGALVVSVGAKVVEVISGGVVITTNWKLNDFRTIVKLKPTVSYTFVKFIYNFSHDTELYFEYLTN